MLKGEAINFGKKLREEIEYCPNNMAVRIFETEKLKQFLDVAIYEMEKP